MNSYKIVCPPVSSWANRKTFNRLIKKKQFRQHNSTRPVCGICDVTLCSRDTSAQPFFRMKNLFLFRLFVNKAKPKRFSIYFKSILVAMTTLLMNQQQSDCNVLRCAEQYVPKKLLVYVTVSSEWYIVCTHSSTYHMYEIQLIPRTKFANKFST